jgi:hypothetical protein
MLCASVVKFALNVLPDSGRWKLILRFKSQNGVSRLLKDGLREDLSAMGTERGISPRRHKEHEEELAMDML